MGLVSNSKVMIFIFKNQPIKEEIMKRSLNCMFYKSSHY